MQRNRVPPADGVADELVDYRFTFAWHFLGKLKVDVVGKTITLPDQLQAGGVYCLRSSVRDGDPLEVDTVYVGRALRDVEERLVAHLKADDMQFKANVQHLDGWVEAYIAVDIKVNGHLLSDETLADERVLEAIESVGVVDALSFPNLRNRR